jgi:hypothetical protein
MACAAARARALSPLRLLALTPSAQIREAFEAFGVAEGKGVVAALLDPPDDAAVAALRARVRGSDPRPLAELRAAADEARVAQLYRVAPRERALRDGRDGLLDAALCAMAAKGLR